VPALSRLDTALSRVDEFVVLRAGRFVNRVRGVMPRWRVRPLSMLAVVLVLAVAGTAFASLVRPDPSGGGSAGSSTVWVGVREGDSIPDYVELSRSKLTALGAQTPDRVVYALASLRRYLTPDEVASMLAAVVGSDAGAALVSVTAYARVPLPNKQTERVALLAINPPSDLAHAMVRVADRKVEDADSYSSMAASQPPGSLRDLYASNADVSRAEAAAYRSLCGCVFALVVRGHAAALQALAAHPDVRAVDPATEIESPVDAVFAPPYPEQEDRVTLPPDDGIPGGADLAFAAPARPDERRRTVGVGAGGR